MTTLGEKTSIMNRIFCFCISGLFLFFPQTFLSQKLLPISHNNPGLTVDLGVGLWAWPMPMDYDRDGDLDLVVACPDVPYDGIYFFENPGGEAEMPVFKAGRRIASSARNLQISRMEGEDMILSPGKHYLNFRETALDSPMDIPLAYDFKRYYGRIRANQWKYLDYDADGDQDLIIGLGVWTDYGWDNAWNSRGVWKNGPLHGYVFLARNTGTTDMPEYQQPEKIMAGNKPIDVYGMPSPSFADFDRDGDLDLICGEFLDGFTYFQNVGNRETPEYTVGQRLCYQAKTFIWTCR